MNKNKTKCIEKLIEIGISHRWAKKLYRKKCILLISVSGDNFQVKFPSIMYRNYPVMFCIPFCCLKRTKKLDVFLVDYNETL